MMLEALRLPGAIGVGDAPGAIAWAIKDALLVITTINE
jgi:hypothetical protein